MTLLYKAVQTNMISTDGEKKWHPHVVKKKRVVDAVTLAREIAERSSLTPGDVYNVIQNLFSSMRHHLLDSESVKLDGLGTFTVKAYSSGNGVSTAEEVSHKQVNRLGVHFTPSYKRVPAGIGVVCPMLSGAQFERVDKPKRTTKAATPVTD